jgi:hypothetical protein
LNKIPVDVPPNVTLKKDIDKKSFFSLLSRSRMVVIPLLENVGSSGQMVCLAAMQYGKAIVYTDFDVISQ